jgi:hypothetical protein
MGQEFSHALEESLILLEEGTSTLDECLARYPQHAADLRPLLELVLGVRRVPLPASTPTNYDTGEQQMLQVLAGKKRHQAAPLPTHRRFVERIASLFAVQRDQATQVRISARRLTVVMTLGLVFLIVSALIFQTWRGTPVVYAATLNATSGVVEVLPTGADTWQPASDGERLEAGAQIRTGPLSAAALVFFDGSTTEIEAETELTIIQMSARRDHSNTVIVLFQDLGQTYNRVGPMPGPASHFRVETPAAVTGVYGTEFVVHVEADGATNVTVVKGAVDVTAQEVTATILTGQEVLVQPEHPPAPARPISEPTEESDEEEIRETESIEDLDEEEIEETEELEDTEETELNEELDEEETEEEESTEELDEDGDELETTEESDEETDKETESTEEPSTPDEDENENDESDRDDGGDDESDDEDEKAD